MKSLIWLFALALALPVYAGHESHGSDSNVESLAWYLGAGKTIHYCLESTEKFRAAGTEKEMRDAIEKTFTIWSKYIKIRQVDTAYFPKKLHSQLTYPDKLEWTKKACDKDADLTFYFGVDNELTRKARERFDDAMALTYIPKYNADESWQKGFVWIANPNEIHGVIDGKTISLDWYEESDVMNVLLHEWGHIFGNGHLQGTVMDSSLKEILLTSHAPGGELREPTIDGSKEFYTLLNVQDEYYVGNFFSDTAAQKQTFKELMGRDAEGTPQVQVELRRNLVALQPTQSRFVVVDDKGPLHGLGFPMDMLFNSPTIFYGEEVFRRKLPDGHVYFDRHSASSFRGYVHFPMNGLDRVFAVSIETNTSPGELPAGTSKVISKQARPVMMYAYGLQFDFGRAIVFMGEHVDPPEGSYKLLPDVVKLTEGE